MTEHSHVNDTGIRLKPVLHVRHRLLLEQVLQNWIADEQKSQVREIVL